MVNDKFLWVFFFNETQAKNRQFGNISVSKRPCIDENHFLQQVCYLSSHIICCTLTDKWASCQKPLVYSCIVRAARYANLVQETAGSQRSYMKRKSLTDFQVFWLWEVRLAMISVLSVCCACFSRQINSCTPDIAFILVIYVQWSSHSKTSWPQILLLAAVGSNLSWR
jgi:hypothetical protein